MKLFPMIATKQTKQKSSTGVNGSVNNTAIIGNLISIAQSQVGVREVGNNGGTQVRAYQASTGMKPGAWPWCAAFICWIVREWLNDPETVKWLNLSTTTPEAWRPKTARAYGFLEWAVERPRTCRVLGPKDKPTPGDLVVYDFSHIGIVTHNNGSSINTIEGNTNARGSRDGDGVWAKQRNIHLVQAFVRIGRSS